MIATMDLQLQTIDFSNDPSGGLPLDPGGRGAGDSEFADELRAHADLSQENEVTGGEGLPPDGNSLPPTLQPVLVTLSVESVPTATNTVAENTGDQPGSVLQPRDNASAATRQAQDAHLGATLLARTIATETPVSPLVPAIDRQSVPPPSSVVPGKKVVVRVHVPPSVDTVLNKEIERVLVPPTAGLAAAADTTPHPSERQTEMIGPRAGLISMQPSAERYTQKSSPESSAILEDTTRYDPASYRIEPGSRTVRNAIRDTVRLTTTKLQPGAAGGSVSTPSPTSIANPSLTASGDFAYAAESEWTTDLIRTPVRASQWADRISERVLTLVGGQQKAAEIRLTPAELGPLRVQISIEDGTANVAFQAHHSLTRDALEQALPRLRELLEDNGMTLGEASVGEHDVNDRQAEGNNSEHSPVHDAADNVTGENVGLRQTHAQRVSTSLLDTFV
jgi:flagellar hook-length control protein FliK